jgi:hypothetical protein
MITVYRYNHKHDIVHDFIPSDLLSDTQSVKRYFDRLFLSPNNLVHILVYPMKNGVAFSWTCVEEFTYADAPIYQSDSLDNIVQFIVDLYSVHSIHSS